MEGDAWSQKDSCEKMDPLCKRHTFEKYDKIAENDIEGRKCYAGSNV